MVFIPKWEKYKKKPSGLVEIDYANELVNNVENIIIADSSGIRELVNFENQVTTVNSGYVAGDIRFNGSSDYIKKTIPAVTSNITLSCVISVDNAPGGTDTVRQVLGTEYFVYSLTHDNSSFSNAVGIRQNSAWSPLSFPDTTIEANEKTVISLSIGADGVLFATNGKVGINASYTYFDVTNSYGFMASAQPTSFTPGEFSLGIFHNKQLSLDEILSLHENPYQILKPRQSFFVFGATGGTQTLTPSVVTNTNTFETAIVTTQNTLTASVVTNDQTFHDVTLTTSNSIVVDLYANSASFHNATVAASNSLQASLVTNTQSFYSADVTPSTSLQASLLTNNQTFHTHVVSLEGAQVVAPNLLTNTQSFYSASVQPGAVSVTAPLVTNIQTFYTANVSQDAVVLQPDLVTNVNTFYSASVSTSITLQAGLFSNSSTFYTPVVSLEGAKTLIPSLVVNTNNFYSATITTGVVSLAPSLVTNTNNFYATTVTSVNTLQPSVATNAPSFYTHVVSAGTATLNPSLFTNSNVFYSADVALGAALQTVQPPLITNTNVFYNGTVTFDQTLDVGLVVNQPIFYNHLVYDSGIYKEIVEFSVSFKMEDIHTVNITQVQDFNIGL